MPDVLIVIILATYKEIVRLEDSELKMAGTLTFKNMMFIEKNKQVLNAMNHKGFLDIVAALERENIVQRIAGPRETYQVTSCPQKMNRGTCQFEAPQ